MSEQRNLWHRGAPGGERGIEVPSAVRWLGRPSEVKARPDVLCGSYSGWGDVKAHCSRDNRCPLCVEEHHTDSRKCPVEGFLGKKGQTCAPSAPTAATRMPLMRTCASKNGGSRAVEIAALATP